MPITSHAGAEHTGTEIEIAFELDKAMRALGADRDQLVVIGDRYDKLYPMFERLGADVDLLCIIGSYGDTQPDEWVLASLRSWNEINPRSP
jgi:hypothetical protein